MGLLKRDGCMDHFSTDGTAVPIPASVQIAGSKIIDPELGGGARIRIVLESDELDDIFRFRGSMSIFSPDIPSDASSANA